MPQFLFLSILNGNPRCGRFTPGSVPLKKKLYAFIDISVIIINANRGIIAKIIFFVLPKTTIIRELKLSFKVCFFVLFLNLVIPIRLF